MIEPMRNIPAAPFTYYCIGGVAREVYFPANTEELLELLRALRASGTDYYILGGGTNVLIGDGYWDGAVIITTKMEDFDTGTDSFTCGAGILSSKAAEIARDHGKTGLEFLYLLPGTLGGALAGNARYDMKNISDILISLDAAHPDYGMRSFQKDDIEFAYKYTSIAREGWIITKAAFRWQDGDPAEINRKMKAIEQSRSEGHHFDYPSCGCVFKNDYSRNIQAGRLLDSLGLKGLREGGAEVSPWHANFIINTGNATARDVRALIERIEGIIRERAGIELAREVRFAGTF